MATLFSNLNVVRTNAISLKPRAVLRPTRIETASSPSLSSLAVRVEEAVVAPGHRNFGEEVASERPAPVRFAVRFVTKPVLQQKLSDGRSALREKMAVVETRTPVASPEPEPVVDRATRLRWATFRVPPSMIRNTAYLSYSRDPLNYVVLYATTTEMGELIAEQLKGTIFGLDAEWDMYSSRKNTKAPGASVLQLCDSFGTIAIFHLHHMKEFPVRLREILENDKLSKFGVGIKGDATKIRRPWDKRNYEVNTVGIVDLKEKATELEKDLDPPISKGLQFLVKWLCKKDLDKEICHKTWSFKNLNTSQKYYAANDAYASLTVAIELAKAHSLILARKRRLGC